MKSFSDLVYSIWKAMIGKLEQGGEALEKLVPGKKAKLSEEADDSGQAQVLPLPDPSCGLTTEEVREREALGLTNTDTNSGVRTTRQIIAAHTFTYFNFLNVFLGFLIFLTGSYKNMLFLGVMVCNSVIGIVQEIRIRNVINGINVITSVKASVLRNGNVSSIPVEEVVRDDVICLAPGDQIIADGTVLSTEYLEVNESLITGESKPVRKLSGDSLLSGSFVVGGSAMMLAEKVGKNRYSSKLVAQTKNRERATSEMLGSINRIIRIISVVIIPIGILLFLSQRAAATYTAAALGYDSHWIFSRSVVRTVSGVIGMIPEGLVLLTSISFLLGIGRLAMKGALVQEMEAMEALARADIICTDKTGTITTGELRISRLVSIGNNSADQIRNIMAHIGGALREQNVTQIALDRYFGRKNDWTVRDRIPFSSDRKYKAVVFEEYGSFVVGAPELLTENKQVLDYVKKYSEKGFRCLLLCSSDGISSEEKSVGKLTPMAVIVISDVIRSNAKETFTYFENAGVCIKVLSGDNPATVSAVAQQAGVKNADHYIDASTLPEDPAAFREAIRDCNIFGRVRPEQKQAFVRAWKEEKHTVAMVGDGVNDVLALKDADCGIAMSYGSEAAKHAAHIVLTQSDFAAMPKIVGEGKTVICNIERVSALYLTKTIYSIILSLIFIILRSSYPWTTLQMGLMNVVGIGMPSFLLALERHDEWKSTGFLIHVLRISLPAALTMVFTVILVQLSTRLFGWPEDMYSLFVIVLGALVALIVVAQVCWPFNWYRRLVWLLCCVTFLLAVLFLSDFYDIHTIWTPWSFLFIPMGAVVGAVLYGFHRGIGILIDKKKAAQKST